PLPPPSYPKQRGGIDGIPLTAQPGEGALWIREDTDVVSGIVKNSLHEIVGPVIRVYQQCGSTILGKAKLFHIMVGELIVGKGGLDIWRTPEIDQKTFNAISFSQPYGIFGTTAPKFTGHGPEHINEYVVSVRVNRDLIIRCCTR
ncbi:MAG: hypothetical protein G8D61_21045, partial [gamma proteobacterium symbiont of Ctena orbiculata]